MTEAQWFSGTNPHEMLVYLQGSKAEGLSSVLSWFGMRTRRTSPRKLQLFAYACCRRIWPLLADERSRQAVAQAERYADGLIDKKAFRQAALAARAAYLDSARPRVMVGGWMAAAQARSAEAVALALDGDDPADDAATCAKEAVRAWATQVPNNEPINPAQKPRLAFPPISPEAAWIAEGSAQCELLRDLIGNPFRAPALDTAWRTPAVVALAKAVFEKNALENLAELANALERTGCTNLDVLHHCRDHQEHARGCWVVDFLLGK